jgi:hypothetical protein
MPVAFDTHLLIQRLMQGQMPLEQAEAISAALTEALDDVIGTLATKKDLDALGADLKKDIAHLSTRLTWMIGIYGGITMLILGKLLLFK